MNSRRGLAGRAGASKIHGAQTPSSARTEADLNQLRKAILERHDIKVSADDPICVEFTMFSEIVEAMLEGLRAERQAHYEELQYVVQGAGQAVQEALQDAARPLARSMVDVLSPKAVADRISAEVFDDLQRASQQALQGARWSAVIISGVATTLCVAALFLASQRLEQVHALLNDPAARHEPEAAAAQGHAPPSPEGPRVTGSGQPSAHAGPPQRPTAERSGAPHAP